jgi:cytoskeleton protein RodZ
VGQLGEVLRSARDEKGVSLAQAEAATMIKRAYLQALEEDDHAGLPGAVYVKGFVRNYAMYLGLDPSHTLSIYHREYPDPSLAPMASATIKPRGTSQLVTGGTVASLLLVVVVSIFSVYIFRQVQAFRQAQPAAEAAAFIATPTPIPPAATPVTPAAVQSSPLAPAPSPTLVPGSTEVTAKASQDAWLQVQVDGQRSFEGVLKAGQTQTWKGKDVFVWAGNAGGVNIVFNGREIGPLGAAGEVVKKDFKTA